MSETIPKFRLTVGTWITIITALGGLLIAVGTFHGAAQDTLESHDNRILRLETRDELTRQEFAAQKELLVRIDERTAEIKRKQELQRP